MTITPPPTPLLDGLPGGALLARVLRLCLCAERGEEFLGDLVEEAHLRLPTSSPRQVALWLWAQALRSLPPLLVLRLQRLAAAALALGGRPLWGSAHGAVVLVGSRVTHPRGLPLSLAVSVSTHALILVAALGWMFSRVDEVDPAGPHLDLWAAAVLDAAEATDLREGQPDPGQPAPARRPRPGRRRSQPAPSPAPAPTVSASTTTSAPTASHSAGTTSALTSTVPTLATPSWDAGIEGAADRVRSQTADRFIDDGELRPRTNLPPRVAEKRCLSCPPPRLEGMQAWIASGRELVVRTCVNARGSVQSVDVVRGLNRRVDAEVTSTVRTWRLLPYRLDGRPVPFCYPIRFLFTNH
jgi:outer membrane biosynthesis protein TonB